MLRGIDHETARFLDALGRVNRRIDQAQHQVSSGLRVSTASDAPEQVEQLLTARGALETTLQLRMNLNRQKTETDAAEQALQKAVQLVERASVLGAQGANGILSETSRRSLALEVESVLEQLAGLAGTSVEGRYLFSGDHDQQAPYSFDLSRPNPAGEYAGSAATRKALDPDGGEFGIARPADEIFEGEDGNVFASVNSLRLALLANDQAAVEDSLAGLTSAGKHLNGQLGFYGAAQNRVRAALDTTQKMELRLKAQVAQIEEADYTEAILALNQARFQQQTALTVRAQAPRSSLFDFLG